MKFQSIKRLLMTATVARKLPFLILLIAFVLILSANSYAQCSAPCLQSVAASNGSTGDTVDIVLSSNTAGSTIVVSLGYCNGASCNNDATGCTAPTVTDTKGQTYTRREYIVAYATGRSLSIFTTENIASGSNTITLHASCPGGGDAAYYLSGIASEFTAASSSFDSSGQGTGNSTTPSATTGATTNANDIMVASVDGVTSPVVGSGYSALAIAYGEYKTVSSTGVQTANWTSDSGQWGAVAVAIKQAGGAPACRPGSLAMMGVGC